MQANTESSEAVGSPDEIIASVAHDLRTPLTALLQTLMMVLSGRLGSVEATQERFLQLGLKSAREMLELVDGLQERSLLRTGRLRVRFQVVDPIELARGVVELVAPLAESRSIDLHFTAGDDVPNVWADPVLVRRALVNLVGNALKFTPEGGRVEVDVALGDGGTRVVHSVRDSGPGIPPAERRKVFERHHRTRKTAARPGSGLGLSIVRDVVEAHAGRVAVVGNGASPGTTFRAAWAVLGSGLTAEAQLRSALASAVGADHPRLVVLRALPGATPGDLHERVAESLPSDSEIVDLGGLAVAALVPDACSDDGRRTPLAFARDLDALVAASLCAASAEAADLVAAARAAVVGPHRQVAVAGEGDRPSTQENPSGLAGAVRRDP